MSERANSEFPTLILAFGVSIQLNVIRNHVLYGVFVQFSVSRISAYGVSFQSSVILRQSVLRADIISACCAYMFKVLIGPRHPGTAPTHPLRPPPFFTPTPVQGTMLRVLGSEIL